MENNINDTIENSTNDQPKMSGPSFINLNLQKDDTKSKETNNNVQNNTNTEKEKTSREKLREKLAMKRLHRLNRGSLKKIYEKHTNKED